MRLGQAKLKVTHGGIGYSCISANVKVKEGLETFARRETGTRQRTQTLRGVVEREREREFSHLSGPRMKRAREKIVGRKEKECRPAG